MSFRQIFNILALLTVFGAGLIIYGWNRWQGIDTTVSVPYEPPQLPSLEEALPEIWRAEIQRPSQNFSVVDLAEASESLTAVATESVEVEKQKN